MRLEWGEDRIPFDRGVDQGVLYSGDVAVPWNGLVSVDEVVSGAVNADYYFEGTRVCVSHENGNLDLRLSAYTYPDIFSDHIDLFDRGASSGPFGFSYRTQDRIHVVYNASVRSDSRSRETLKKEPNPLLFAWSVDAIPRDIPGASPAARLTLEPPKDPAIAWAIENILYGSPTTQARLPEPEELIELFESVVHLKITYNGDGTYTAEGPDDVLRSLGDGRFEISAPTAQYIGGGRFSVSSSY